ncbi:hypothetical protein GALL_530310 [mine drainage metagenome]|uniref:Uncharacterized protein n=1 Tax=mine drainage metagenome TaxID=410659 RepID=A0A1J5P2W8_9ZZZZ
MRAADRRMVDSDHDPIDAVHEAEAPGNRACLEGRIRNRIGEGGGAAGRGGVRGRLHLALFGIGKADFDRQRTRADQYDRQKPHLDGNGAVPGLAQA